MASGEELLVARGTSLQAPLTVSTFRKAPPPKTGDRHGTWGPDSQFYARLPGGSVLTFDLTKLTLQDYRQMRDDYQLSASLNVLAFMVAQCDWSIQCADPKIASQIETNLRSVWFSLMRSVTQAYWAGYSPTVKTFDLNPQSKYYEITNFKDLVPDMCRVSWLKSKPEGFGGATIYTFNGIDNGNENPIPVDFSWWYPLLMENGNMYGRKLLRPAFPSWFFSQLMHLFTNRYFERFGEPTAVGYYPADETIRTDGTDPTQQHSSRSEMENILQGLRSRGVVTLPSERDDNNNPLWDLKYMESQMRGVDFDRYIARLDEEKSLALFTPMLMFRTGDRGSYNLGTMHMQVFQFMLNSLIMDLKSYIDAYIIKQLHDVNFGPNAPIAEIRFRTLGRVGDDGAISILQALLQNQGAKLDTNGLNDLGAYLGLSLEEVAQITGTNQGGPPMAPTPEMNQASTSPPPPHTDPRLHPGMKSSRTASILGGGVPPGKKPAPNPGGKSAPRNPVKFLRAAQERLDTQLVNAYASKTQVDLSVYLPTIKLGYKGAFVDSMIDEGADRQRAEKYFEGLESDVRIALEGMPDATAASDAVRAVFAQYVVDSDD